VEFATLEWVDWFNHRRLLEPIGNIPPAEAEERYYATLDQPDDRCQPDQHVETAYLSFARPVPLRWSWRDPAPGSRPQPTERSSVRRND
ncbi:MAG: hypothetical protein ABJN42_06370, partial [Roseibium sp.]